MKLLKYLALTILVAWLSGCGTPYATVPNRDAEPVMLLGYDPVAYFTKGAPSRGRADARNIESACQTVPTILRALRTKRCSPASPARYEPQYGGFCASGAAFAIKLGSDPTSWQIYEGRLFIFGDILGQLAWQVDPKWNVDHGDRLWPGIEDQGWRAASLKGYVSKVPHYKTGKDIRAEHDAKFPGKPWPNYDVGSMMSNLFTKPPGWRAAEGHSQPALGYPE